MIFFQKIVKSSSEATANIFNEAIVKLKFHDNLELAGVTPVFEKDDPFY